MTSRYRKILLLHGAQSYVDLMRKYGAVCHVVDTYRTTLPPETDLIVLTGGSDVNPVYYGEPAHTSTRVNPTRDSQERAIIQKAHEEKIPCVGICRGAQFLSVMNGDKLIQHVGLGHSKPHYVLYEGSEYLVNSTHHQMMVGARGEVIAFSKDVADTYEDGDKKQVILKDGHEPEVVWYDATDNLCVQFHPERSDKYQSEHLFNQLLEEYIL